MSFVSKISGVEFYPLSDNEVKNRAAVVITNKNQFTDKGPEPHGIYDSRLGTIYSTYLCATCGHGVRKCPGHNGAYELKYPICHIISIRTVFKFLKVICVYCNRFIMNPAKPEHKFFHMSSVDEIINFIQTTKIKQTDAKKKIFCDYCNEGRDNITLVQPKYIFKSINDQNHIKVKAAHSGDGYKSVSGTVYDKTMYGYEIYQLFEGLADAELIKFGIPLVCHPKNLYAKQLFILPSNMRFINNDNKNSYSNQHTACIDKMIRANSEIPGEVPSKKDTLAFGSYIDAADKLILQYIEYIKVKGDNDSNDTIFSKLKGKKGNTRLLQLGKSVGKVFRVVIVCDTDCPIDTIKIPRRFASVLTVDETITEYNIERLTKIFNNGSNYPGYNEITSSATDKKYDSRNTNYRMQIGDVIHRHVLDGDTVPFHRYPTLTSTCTTTMKIIVHKDNTSAVAFNVLACDLFNADYDGDTMMGFMIGHEGIRCEANHIMNMNNGYNEGKVTSGSNAFILGQVLDSVISFAKITKNNVRINRYQVMNLVRDVQINQLLDKKVYTGREVMSLVMPKIQYTANSPMFSNPLIKKHMSFRPSNEEYKKGDTRFDESDTKINIVDGKILSGVICGAAIKNSPNSIYHLIYDQYGSRVAHKIIFYHQQILKRYAEIDCFSIGYKDIVLEKQAYEMMDLVQSRIMAQLNEIKNQIMNKNIIPPLGKSIKNYIDELTLGVHANSENAYLLAILRGCKPDENAFFMSSITGAKGKMSNIYNMLAPLGQIKIDGKRIPSILDYQRYTIHYPQFSLDPCIGGYVNKSYVGGIPPKCMYTVCRTARANVLVKGLVVGEAGAAGRDLIKVMESLNIDNRLWTVRNKGENILEFAVADDGFESSTLINNDYFILSKTTEQIKIELSAKKHKHQLADKLIENILADKLLFLKLQRSKEITNYNHETLKVLQTPFNMNQLIYIITGNAEAKPTAEEFKDMLVLLADYVDNVHYLKINSVHRKRKSTLIKTTELTMTAIKMIIRLYFNPSVLEKMSYVWLDTILNNISAKILEVLHMPGKNIGTITGQTLTAPLTQYLIDAHAAATTGGTSRDGLKYYKHVTSLKELNKLPENSKRMYIFLKEKYEDNENVVQNLADFIGTIPLTSFIISLQILAEKYGECITFPEDKNLYLSNPKIQSDGLYPIVFRYILNTDKMESKNVTIVQLASNIEKCFKGMVHVVYMENIMHMYFNSQFDFTYLKEIKSKIVKLYTVWEKIALFAVKFNEHFIVNGLPGITSVYVKSRNKTIINDDGSIGKKKVYYIMTNGVNMKDVLLINVVDKQKTSCSHIQETCDYFGLLAGRDKFVSEIGNTFVTLKLAHNNYNFTANVMFEKGYPTNLAEKGQKVREPNDPLLHSAFKNPMNAIKSAIINNTHNNLSSPSANLMMGKVPDIGTYYNTLIHNFDFYKSRQSNKIENLI